MMTDNSKFPQDVGNRMTLLSCRLLIDTYLDDYIRLVQRFLFDQAMQRRILALLPFDRQIQTVARIPGSDHPIATMGFCLMRMDMEPPMFSFGISLELKGDDEQALLSSVSFIVACKTLEELRNWVCTEAFRSDVKTHFDRMISEGFWHACQPGGHAENQEKDPNAD